MMANINPEILLHPNIPKPLHGLNPRTVKGQDWWDSQRLKAYKSRDYHCWACGIHKSEAMYHQWLEAHETYEYDYPKGLATVKEIVALCHCCHNFIHNGKAEMEFMSGKIDTERLTYIMQHGTNLLSKNKLPMNIFAFSVIKRNNLRISNIPAYLQQTSNTITNWEDWRLDIDGELFKPKFKNYEEWKKYYSSTEAQHIDNL